MTGQVTPFFAITLEGQQLIHIRHIDLFLYRSCPFQKECLKVICQIFLARGVSYGRIPRIRNISALLCNIFVVLDVMVGWAHDACQPT